MLTRKVKKLEQKLGIEENFMQARAIPWLKEFFGKKMSSGAWVVVGQQLRGKLDIQADEIKDAYWKLNLQKNGTLNVAGCSVTNRRI